MKRACISMVAVTLLAGAAVTRVQAVNDIVLYATDFTTLRGNWTLAPDSTAAGGRRLASADRGWSSPNTPLAGPSDYVETTFTASAATPYHVWVRLRAGNNSKYNDSVWVQFSDAVGANGAAIFGTAQRSER